MSVSLILGNLSRMGATISVPIGSGVQLHPGLTISASELHDTHVLLWPSTDSASLLTENLILQCKWIDGSQTFTSLAEIAIIME